jgi:hypothetical protein
MHGQGVLEYPSYKETKARYEGEFQNNRRHGHGKRYAPLPPKFAF